MFACMFVYMYTYKLQVFPYCPKWGNTCSPEAILNSASNQEKPKSTFILLFCEMWGLLGVMHALKGLKILRYKRCSYESMYVRHDGGLNVHFLTSFIPFSELPPSDPLICEQVYVY